MINTEGDVVLERNEMSRNVMALKKFLVKQGYDPEQIEAYLNEKKDLQDTNMRKAVIGFFFKNSDFEILPRAMRQWRQWIAQRKMYRKQMAFCINSMNHPLSRAFRKWKFQEAYARDKLKHLSKTDMVDKIVSDEMAIGSAESRMTRMDDAIEHLSI